MNTKLQILDYVQILVGFFSGVITKILEGMAYSDIKTIFAVVNICSLLFFTKGVIDLLEDKYGVKFFDINSKKIVCRNKKVLH